MAAGLWLLPIIGIQGIFRFGIAVNAGLGAWILVRTAQNLSLRLRKGVAAAALIIAGFALLQNPWDVRNLSSGTFRYRTAPPDYEMR